MLNKPGGIIFDRFGELKLLKKIIKQMQMIEELQEEEVEVFTILPQSKLQKRFILIDSIALHHLLSITNRCGLGKISLDDFNENIEHWWRMTFNIDKESNNKKQASIMTDGISVSVNLKKEIVIM